MSDLGDKNIMILRNHGFVVVGKTIQEAFIMMYHLILACETQVQQILNPLKQSNPPGSSPKLRRCF